MSKPDQKPTYTEMIITALKTLNERGGASRQQIWKCLEAQNPGIDRKIFLARLKKGAKDGIFLKPTQAKFKINREL